MLLLPVVLLLPQSSRAWLQQALLQKLQACGWQSALLAVTVLRIPTITRQIAHLSNESDILGYKSPINRAIEVDMTLLDACGVSCCHCCWGL